MAEPRITLQPTKFRDVYWCPLLREPFIIEWRGDLPRCRNCGLIGSDNGHFFIVHILKPPAEGYGDIGEFDVKG